MSSYGAATEELLEAGYRGYQVPQFEGVSEATDAARSALNTRFKAVVDELRSHRNAAQAAVDALQSADGGLSVGEKCAAARDGIVACAERLVHLWRQRRSLCEQMRDELRARMPAAEARRAELAEKAGKKLKATGVTVETMPAYPANGAAAQRQLDHLVRSVCPDARAAAAEATDAANRAAACETHIGAARQGEEAALRYLRSVAVRYVGG